MGEALDRSHPGQQFLPVDKPMKLANKLPVPGETDPIEITVIDIPILKVGTKRTPWSQAISNSNPI